MTDARQDIEAAIKQHLIEICDELGEDARSLDVDDIIPASGLVDSAGLLALLTWYEGHFGISLGPDDVTIDNLGSIRLMAEFVLKRGKKV